jgi:hypothetical protein
MTVAVECENILMCNTRKKDSARAFHTRYTINRRPHSQMMTTCRDQAPTHLSSRQGDWIELPHPVLCCAPRPVALGRGVGSASCYLVVALGPTFISVITFVRRGRACECDDDVLVKADLIG